VNKNERKRIYGLLDEALTALHIAHTLTPKGEEVVNGFIREAEQLVADADKALRRKRPVRPSKRDE
jgi:hypothetical protein